MAEQIETTEQLDRALAGEVLVDIGHIGPGKNCWSTPEVAAYFAEMKSGIASRKVVA